MAALRIFLSGYNRKIFSRFTPRGKSQNMKLQLDLKVENPSNLSDFIAAHSELSKSSIKKALNFGGGWLQLKGKGKVQRCRRATKELQPGDRVKFYFDDHLYQQVWPEPKPILQTHHWGVWYKPVNLVAQGTPYGDTGTMEQQVQQLSGHKQVFLIHRLDREASGLMIFAYTSKNAAALSALWQTDEVQKTYQIEVHGIIHIDEGRLDEPLDNKPCTTEYRVVKRLEHSTLLEVRLHTGRFHQIRRHFAQRGHPVMGDPAYAAGFRADPRGLQLIASQLKFSCPERHNAHTVELPKEYCLF
jgi:tRNA pseudouridine32 synthase / 23S rRNA pseudouridine746 synthase